MEAAKPLVDLIQNEWSRTPAWIDVQKSDLDVPTQIPASPNRLCDVPRCHEAPTRTHHRFKMIASNTQMLEDGIQEHHGFGRDELSEASSAGDAPRNTQFHYSFDSPPRALAMNIYELAKR